MSDLILNGAFDVWSLGTDFQMDSHLKKTADRWNCDYNGNPGVAWVNRTEVQHWAWLDGFQPKYCLRFNQSQAGSGNTFQDVSTQIERVSSYQGKEITISFYCTYYSGPAPTFTAIKTEQYFGSGGSPSAPQFTTSAPLTVQEGAGIWRRYSITTVLADTKNKVFGTENDDTLNIIFTLPLNAIFDLGITCVQIDEGPAAKPFRYKTLGATTSDCQRFLQSSYSDGVSPGTVTTTGIVGLTLPGPNSIFTIPFKNSMRETPVAKYYNPVTGQEGFWNCSGRPVKVVTNTSGPNNLTIQVVGGNAGEFVSGHYVIQDALL